MRKQRNETHTHKQIETPPPPLLRCDSYCISTADVRRVGEGVVVVVVVEGISAF